MSASPLLPASFSDRPGRLRQGEKGTPLAAVDVAWLRMDDPTNLMHVQGVLPLQGEVSWEEAARPMRERLEKIPRFRQRIAVDDDGRPFWVDDPEFDLRRHLVEERIDERGDDAALTAAIERHLERQLDFAHPLWEFRLLQGHRDGTVLFGKIHHVIGDGVALMTVVLALTDLAPAGPATTEIPEGLDSAGANPFFEILMRRGERAFAEARALAERVMPELVRLMVAPVEAYARVNVLVKGAGASGSLARLVARPSDPATRFKGALRREKKVAWTGRIPLEDVKGVGRAHGGTINDVLGTAMVGGLRRYLARDGEPAADLAFRAAMPVSLRPLEEMANLGNRFGLVFLRLPVGIADPHRRLETLRERTSALKRSTEPLVVFTLLKAMGALPEWVHRAMLAIFQTKATAVFTNVPGPRQKLWFAGRAVRDFYFWVPQAGRLGLGLSILSYDGGVRMGVATDAGLVPDPQRIVDGFHAEFEALQRSG
jgi:WS/DGAT/MGAT family acyltransferase